jgi:hypothetical protein
MAAGALVRPRAYAHRLRPPVDSTSACSSSLAP